MTTMTPRPRGHGHRSRGPRDFRTLTSVELRKMTDTRSGRGLLIAILTLVAAVLAWKLTHAEVEVSFDNYGVRRLASSPSSCRVIGLLAMTSEWTQRTALTTFTLAPRRLPVIAAKFVSADQAVARRARRRPPAWRSAATGIGGLVHGRRRL